MDVVGIGALNLDFLYDIEDLSYLKTLDLDIDEGREILGTEKSLEPLRTRLTRFGTLHKVSPGGSASNTCHVLSHLGYSAGLMGVLGEDKEGDVYLKQICYEDTGLVARRGTTGMAYIVNTAKRDRAIILFPNSNSDLKHGDINISALSRTRLIHMTSLVSAEGLAIQREIKEQLTGRVLFSVDPGETYARLGADLFPLIEGVEVLFTTQTEMELIFSAPADKAREKALEMAKVVVVKKGKEGASVYAEDCAFDVSAVTVDAVDNTGAGDVLNGVFLALYMRELDLATALKVAVKAASISVTGYGRDAYPDGQAIEETMNEK